jgi:hypothetical protein
MEHLARSLRRRKGRLMDYPEYWRDIVINNLRRIEKEFGKTIAVPTTEENAKNLYHQWLHRLSLREEDL